MKGKGKQFGLSSAQAEDRSHAFVEEFIPAPEKWEPAEVHQ